MDDVTNLQNMLDAGVKFFAFSYVNKTWSSGLCHDNKNNRNANQFSKQTNLRTHLHNKVIYDESYAPPDDDSYISLDEELLVYED